MPPFWYAELLPARIEAQTHAEGQLSCAVRHACQVLIYDGERGQTKQTIHTLSYGWIFDSAPEVNSEDMSIDVKKKKKILIN